MTPLVFEQKSGKWVQFLRRKRLVDGIGVFVKTRSVKPMPNTSFWVEVVRTYSSAGQFAFGTMTGCAITGIAFYFAGKERRARLALDLQREKVLLEQLTKKDNRITALHKQIEELQTPKALPPAEKKKE